MKRLAKRFLSANSATSAVEYGLIAAMVALAIAAGAYVTGARIQTAFRQVTDNMATGSIEKGGEAAGSGFGTHSGPASDGN